MFKVWNVYLCFFMAWLLVITLTLITRTTLLSIISIFYTGLIPFIFAILFISRTIIEKKLESIKKKWYFAVYLSWVIFMYSIFAQRWASETLNNIFQINAVYLSITYKLLAFLFAPFGIVYQAYILSRVWLLFILISLILSTILPLFLIFNIRFKIIGKALGVFFLIFIFISFSVPMLSTMMLHQEQLIIKFALWADFNSKNLCTDSWVNNTESILFLDGNKVLAYHPNNPEGYRFTVETCNYNKTF
ncbi:hypothetical protein ACU6XK_11125 [Klebsiella aerogenes]